MNFKKSYLLKYEKKSSENSKPYDLDLELSFPHLKTLSPGTYRWLCFLIIVYYIIFVKSFNHC